MASQRNTGAFFAGSVLGGILGAAAVLWTTPKSGPELRGSLQGSRTGAVTYRGDAATGELTATEGERRFSNPVLSFVEKAAAPIVGVELGKLAKDDPNTVSAAPVRASAADARPPAPGGRVITGTSPAQPVAGFGTVDTGVAAAQSPDEEVTHDPVEGSSAHAATPEELTSPTPEYVEQLGDSAPATDADVVFPDLASRDDASRA
jgi:hypothetical protein